MPQQLGLLFTPHSVSQYRPFSTAIYGQYKTGTTAIFSLIKTALHNKPRAEFEALKHTPHPEDNQTGVLAKVILKFPGHPKPVDYDSFNNFHKHIYITRDPRDWLVSGTVFLAQEKPGIYRDPKKIQFVIDYLKQKESSPEDFPLIGLLKYILEADAPISLMDFAKRTQAQHQVCMEFETRLSNYLRISYEDFVDQRWQPIADYLSIRITQPLSVEDRFGHVKRSATYGNWKSWLSKADVDFFTPYFQPYIDHYNYQSDWNLEPVSTLNPAHGSDYVSKTVKMKLGRENP